MSLDSFSVIVLFSLGKVLQCFIYYQLVGLSRGEEVHIIRRLLLFELNISSRE